MDQTGLAEQPTRLVGAGASSQRFDALEAFIQRPNDAACTTRLITSVQNLGAGGRPLALDTETFSCSAGQQPSALPSPPVGAGFALLTGADSLAVEVCSEPKAWKRTLQSWRDVFATVFAANVHAAEAIPVGCGRTGGVSASCVETLAKAVLAEGGACYSSGSRPMRINIVPIFQNPR